MQVPEFYDLKQSPDYINFPWWRLSFTLTLCILTIITKKKNQLSYHQYLGRNSYSLNIITKSHYHLSCYLNVPLRSLSYQLLRNKKVWNPKYIYNKRMRLWTQSGTNTFWGFWMFADGKHIVCNCTQSTWKSFANTCVQWLI